MSDSVSPDRRPKALSGPLDTQRDAVVDDLQSAFAGGDLTLDELDERLELAHSARDDAELTVLVEDLPGRDALVESRSQDALPVQRESESSALATRREQTPLTLTAIFGESKRRGAWTPPEVIVARAAFGEVDIDLCEAVLPPGSTTTIHCTAVFGSVEIDLPRGVRVEADGIGIFGSFEDRSQTASEPDAPVVRITGRAVFGSVEIDLEKRLGRERMKREKKEKKRLAREKKRAKRLR